MSRRATGNRKRKPRKRSGGSPTRTGPCSLRRKGMRGGACVATMTRRSPMASRPVNDVQQIARPTDTHGFADAERSLVAVERPAHHHLTAAVEPDRILDGIAHVDNVLDAPSSNVICAVSICEPRRGLRPQHE